MDFWNELGKKIASRTDRSRDDGGDGKLREAREALERQMAELGRAYYESVDGTSQAVPAAQLDAVREALERVARLSARREPRRVRCPACGAVQPDGARFCANCGKRMPEPPPQLHEDATPDAAYCPACGAMRLGEERYCALCGADLAPEATSMPPAVPASARREGPEEPAEDRSAWQ